MFATILATLQFVVSLIIAALLAYITVAIRSANHQQTAFKLLLRNHICPNKTCNLPISGSCNYCHSYLASRYNTTTIITTKTPAFSIPTEINMSYSLIPFTIHDMIMQALPRPDPHVNTELINTFQPQNATTMQTHPLVPRVPTAYDVNVPSTYEAPSRPRSYSPGHWDRLPPPQVSHTLQPRFTATRDFSRRSAPAISSGHPSSSEDEARPVTTLRQQKTQRARFSPTPESQPLHSVPRPNLRTEALTDEESDTNQYTPVPFAHPQLTTTHEPPPIHEIVLSSPEPSSSTSSTSFPTSLRSLAPQSNFDRSEFYDTKEIMDKFEDREIDIPSFAPSNAEFPTSSIQNAVGLLAIYVQTSHSPTLNLRQSSLPDKVESKDLTTKLSGTRTDFLKPMISAHQLLHGLKTPIPTTDATCFICHINKTATEPEATKALPSLLSYLRDIRVAILDEDEPTYSSHRRQLTQTGLINVLRHC